MPSPSEAEISAFLGPELARIWAAWESLPDAIKVAILALVETSPKPMGGDHEQLTNHGGAKP